MPPMKKVAGDGAKQPAAKAPKPKVKWPFPRATLEQALKVPYALKEHNGGNPWETDEVRKAVGASAGQSLVLLKRSLSRLWPYDRHARYAEDHACRAWPGDNLRARSGNRTDA